MCSVLIPYSLSVRHCEDQPIILRRRQYLVHPIEAEPRDVAPHCRTPKLITPTRFEECPAGDPGTMEGNKFPGFNHARPILLASFLANGRKNVGRSRTIE